MKLARLAVVAACLVASTAALADIEADRDAGLCAAYAELSGKPKAIEDALRMADDFERAGVFALEAIAQVNRWRERGQWTQAVQQGWASRGVAACSRIGIRVSDY
jgi:hypothetical protein